MESVKWFFEIEMSNHNHMVVYVDGLMRPVPLAPVPEPSGLTAAAEEEIWSAECRICQEESAIKSLESPCACNGSLKVSFFLVNDHTKETIVILEKN